jgi:hypothetical protein
MKKTRPKKVRPIDHELFELAEKVALIFDRPEAAPLRARLLEEALAYRNQLRPYRLEGYWQTMTKWIAFLLRMILVCPRLLSRPPEFEWVMGDLEWILTQRRLDPDFDRDFWDAMSRVKKVLRTGYPRNRALDSFRFNTVQGLMHAPVEFMNTDVRVKTFSKSEAVERAAELEGKLFGRQPPHERVVYRSVARVEKELTELTALLRAPSSLGPPPTEQRDSPRIKKTSKRSRRSPRQKRVKRK